MHGQSIADAATIAAYPGALLALRLAGEVVGRDAGAQVWPGEYIYAASLDALDFSRARVTLLTRAA